MSFSPISILYRDDDVLVVHKPGGLLVHRSAIDRRETRFLMQVVRDQVGQYVYPVHRLDKPTCGIVLMALSRAMAESLSRQFQAREVEKTYLAVVRGYTALSECIDYPLQEQLDAKSDALADGDKAAQSAVTDYRRLATLELPYAVGRYPSARYSLLALRPQTGRKHQLRRHLKHVFHPIVGDTTHGDGKHNQLFRRQLECQALLLCAWRLAFRHPRSGAPLVVSTRPDEDFLRILASQAWRLDAEGDSPQMMNEELVAIQPWFLRATISNPLQP